MTWLVDTLLVTGALIALVLVLRRPVARWFGPGMAYALWALPLLRLVLPPLVLPEAQAPGESIVAMAAAEAVAVSTAPPASGWTLTDAAVLLWFAGALGLLAWRVWGYRAMRRRLLAGARPVGESGAIRLVESADTHTPVAFGLWDKVVALPRGFIDQPDRARRDLAIAHELEHHAGRDVAVNFAMQPLLALHWFNPLAWVGWRALRRDQEAACDARVLAGTSAATRAAYGELIAGFARGPRLSLATPLACPIIAEKSIVYRLRSLTMTEPTLRSRLLGRALIGAAALALPLTASITYAAADDPAPADPQVKVSKKIIIIDHKDGATLEDGKVIDDSKLHTRTIVRDGKTIVLKTAKPLSDAEAEASIAKAEASMAGAHAMAEGKPGEHRERKIMFIGHGDHAEGAAAAAHHGEHRVMVLKGDGPGLSGIDHEGHPVVCSEGGETARVSAEGEKDGKREVVKLRFCNKGGTPAQALTAIRKARETLSANTELSADVRAKALEALDREIERLSKAG